MFINKKQLKGDSSSEASICEKALDINGDLVKKTFRANSKDFDFKARSGWFEIKKRRSGIHSVFRHGEVASSNKKAEGFVPQQVFDGDETCIFLKKLPNRTFITKEEKPLPGHKLM